MKRRDHVTPIRAAVLFTLAGGLSVLASAWRAVLGHFPPYDPQVLLTGELVVAAILAAYFAWEAYNGTAGRVHRTAGRVRNPASRVRDPAGSSRLRETTRHRISRSSPTSPFRGHAS
jgi:hypothetical protein